MLRVAKDKFKEKTERLDIQRKEKIAPKTDMQEPARLQREKDVARLCALEVKQEDLEASLGLQQHMCEEMVEIMKGLIVKLGKCTEMDNVRQEEKHFQHELDIFRTQIKTVNLIYTT